MPSRWVYVAIMCVVVALAGCGGDDEDPILSPDPSSTTSVTTSGNPPAVPGTTCKGGPACSNKEVTETGCDDGNAKGEGTVKPVDAIPGKVVTLVDKAGHTFVGALTLRLSNPQACTNIFWGHVKPAPGNAAQFEVHVVVNGKPSLWQSSLPDNLEVWAWSVGVYAPKGAKVTACVRIKGSTTTTSCLLPTTAS